MRPGQFYTFFYSLCTGCLLLLQHNLHAQQSDTMAVNAAENNAAYRLTIQQKYQKQGFLTAWCDSVNPTHVAVVKGPAYSNTRLTFAEMGMADTVLTIQQIIALGEQWLRQQENSGYPFASLKFIPYRQSGDSLSIMVQTRPGEFYKVDTLIYNGISFSRRFVKWSRGVTQGEAYNHAAYLKMLQRWSLLEGISVGKEPELKVVNSKLHVFVPATKSSRDYISGLIGLATQPNGRPVFTGEFNARLYNMFGAGAYTSLEWRSFRARSQQLNIHGDVPYIFGAPFVLNYRLGFEKFDTLFSNFSRGVDAKVPLAKNFAVLFGFSQTDRFRIFADTQSLKTFRSLPSNPPIRSSEYRLGISLNKLKRNTLPEKGLKAYLNAGAGQRRFVRDPLYESFTWKNASGAFENVYDSLQRTGKLKVTTYRIEGHIENYFKLHNGIVLKMAGDGYLYRAPQVYFNELMRFGGIKNLRGFFEQSIFASEFYMSTMELRFQSSQTGYIGPFWHLAWYRDQSGYSNTDATWLQGMGIAAALRTKAGVVNLAWALGKTGTTAIQFNQSRFHLGISTDF